MNWRDTWRATVDSFLRELRDPDEPSAEADDPLIAAIAAARRETGELERDLEAVSARLERELRSVEECERRQEMAARIGDHETAAIAGRFGRRHAARADVLRRKHDVLRDELVLARVVLHDLLDLARVEPRNG